VVRIKISIFSLNLKAFEAARLESEKAQSRQTQFISSKDEQRKKSLDRWHQAVEKEKTQKVINKARNVYLLGISIKRHLIIIWKD